MGCLHIRAREALSEVSMNIWHTLDLLSVS